MRQIASFLGSNAFKVTMSKGSDFEQTQTRIVNAFPGARSGEVSKTPERPPKLCGLHQPPAAESARLIDQTISPNG
jgi:hypothetical protein